MAFSITLAHSIDRFTQGLTGRRAEGRTSPLARARRLAVDIGALLGDRDVKGGAEKAGGGEGARDAMLASARQQAAAWRARAEDAEARVAAMEARLVEAERTAMELRSRVVCLHGKLAATADTLRYHSMTLALDVAGQDADTGAST